MIRITTTGDRRWSRRAALTVATIGMLALAGCSGVTSGGGTQTNGAGSSGTTVTVHDASGHSDTLATADGRTLYMSDQEHGKVLCTSSDCTAIWLPLTVGAGTSPTGPSQLSGKLSTLMRPDGKNQVTFDGTPLYTFSFDHGSGEVGGDNQKDSFGGTDFTWHVATTGGATPAPSAPASPSSGGYSY